MKTLIAAYKTLGGSFTGNLAVNPTHLRERRIAEGAYGPTEPVVGGSDRRWRVRDAVEAALSDVILLGTPEQVSLAVEAANDMVAGRPVETAALVVSLRAFIREVLDLNAVPAGAEIPKQGPLRPASGSARVGRGERAGSSGAGRAEGLGDDGAGTSGLGRLRELEPEPEDAVSGSDTSAPP